MPKTYATCLGDVRDNAVRLLAGTRSLSSAGFGLNSGSAQTATVTIATKHTGDVVTTTVNGTAYAYTVGAGDADEAAVATALAALIDADSAVAAAAVGAVITVTASDATKAFTISSAVTGTGATTTAATVVTHVSVQKIATANTLQYAIDGQTYSVAATADIAVGGDTLPVSSTRWYLVSVDASGNFTATPNQTTQNVDGTTYTLPVTLPPIPANEAACGAVKVATDATHTFIPGTTALNATGITTTFYNLAVVPAAGHP